MTRRRQVRRDVIQQGEGRTATLKKDRKTRLQRIFPSEAPCNDPPTPQTRRKLRQDVVRRLLERGRLQPHHVEAAEEIRAVHEAVGRGMFPTSQSMMWSGRGPNQARSRDFLDRMTDAERYAWQHRYLPWTHGMATEIAAGIPGTRWLQLVVDIVVDNATLREIEERYRLRHGAAQAYLSSGLDRYDLRRR